MRCSRAVTTFVVAVLVACAVAVTGGAPASAAGTFTASVDGVLSPAAGQLRFYGWMFDDDAPSVSISYHVYVGGSGPGDPGSWGYDMGPAAAYRPDVDAVYGSGPYHGFDATISVPVHGTQPVYIFAINAGGTSGGNALIWSGSVAIANPPPETTITSRPPASSTDRTASFGFASSEASTFSCSWDQAAWQPCTSPASATVAVGTHSFAVRATDVEGATDPSPATYSFTVTAPPPPPPPTTPTTPVPPPPETVPTPPAAPQLTLRLAAVRKKSRLRVDVGPDLDPSNYRFIVKQRTGKKWRTVRRTQTLGAQDVMVVDLPRGTYRVVVPRQHDLLGAEATVRLKR